MSNEDINKLYDRMRETEAQTREQNVQIASLTDRIDTMVERYDKMMEKYDKNMDRMWKLVYILVLAILSIALGPKLAEKLSSVGAGMVSTKPDIIAWHDQNHLENS